MTRENSELNFLPEAVRRYAEPMEDIAGMPQNVEAGNVSFTAKHDVVEITCTDFVGYNRQRIVTAYNWWRQHGPLRHLHAIGGWQTNFGTNNAAAHFRIEPNTTPPRMPAAELFTFASESYHKECMRNLVIPNTVATPEEAAHRLALKLAQIVEHLQ
ncbi:hypothetical protein Ddc_01138 [Ditylenchus destructor]|nr:hypothetical protein Ddc_01138 [Ditylenchus destructor]